MVYRHPNGFLGKINTNSMGFFTPKIYLRPAVKTSKLPDLIYNQRFSFSLIFISKQLLTTRKLILAKYNLKQRVKYIFIGQLLSSNKQRGDYAIFSDKSLHFRLQYYNAFFLNGTGTTYLTSYIFYQRMVHSLLKYSAMAHPSLSLSQTF